MNSGRMLDLIAANAYFFICGIIDSLSIQRTLPLLVNDSTIALLTVQILAINAVLLLGSIAVFNHGVTPILYQINGLVLEEQEEAASNSYLGWLLYQSLWLTPICLLCYVLSVGWYQSLADQTFKHLRKTPRASTVARVVTDSIYSTLVWIFAYLQMQILIRGVPLVMITVDYAWNLFFDGLSSSDPLQAMLVASLQRGYEFLSVFTHNLSTFAGLSLMSWLYGWYPFDYVWASEGALPDVRYNTLHTHWAYFLGFGFPYVALVRLTGFFAGYGIFLACFPFSIMLASLADCDGPYRSKKYRQYSTSLEFFHPAKKCAAYTLRVFERKYRALRKPKK